MNSAFGPIFKKLQNPAKLIILITFFIVAAFELLTRFPNTDAGFFGVLGGLFVLIIMVALWALVPTLLLLKQEGIAKKVFPFILFYWLLNEIVSFLSDASFIRSEVDGLYVTSCVFKFLIALAFIAAIVLIVLGMFKKSLDFGYLPYVIAAGTYLFYFILFIMRLVLVSKGIEGAWSEVSLTQFLLEGEPEAGNWKDYFRVIISCLVQPVAMFFATIYFLPPKQADEN